MEDIEKAKKIYADILSAINTIEFDCEVYCGIPPFIEFNGVIYQPYQCLSEEEIFKFGKRLGQQMMDVTEGKTKLYFKQTFSDNNAKDGE